MPRNDEYVKMNDRRDENRFHDMLRDEVGMGQAYDRTSRQARDMEQRYPQGMAGGFVGRGPKNYERSDDRIRDDVCEALTNCADIDASDIEVQVKSGEVTLTGSVHDRYMKRLSEDIVNNLRGVKDVHNRLSLSGGRQS